MSDFKHGHEREEQPEAVAPSRHAEPVQLLSAMARRGQADDVRAVQADGDLAGPDPHAIAAEGAASAGEPLPFLDQIQAAFGEHDVSGVKSHTGEQAQQAAGALGARAYATGEDVVFGEAPDLHTAAHEAAHVVQQRMGVDLPGGLGQAGDAYEQHADRVADAVVAGGDAEGLLDAGPGGQGGGIQARGAQAAARFAQRVPGPSVQRARQPALQLRSRNGVSLSRMRFNPRKIKTDGATTAQATVRYRNRNMAGGATINWSMEGDAHGATVDATGKVTPPNASLGNDKKRVRLTVKAVDSKEAGAYTTGRLTMWDAKYLKAKKDYATFRKQTYTKKNFVSSAWAVSKFDVTYIPRRRRLNVNVNIKFQFLNDKAGARNWSRRDKRRYINRFMRQVRRRWSGQWQFTNARDPKSVWSRLGPVRVRVTATSVQNNQHFLAKVHKKVAGVTVAVNPGNTADLTPNEQHVQNNPFPATKAAELTRLQAKIPSPVNFAAGAFAVPAGAVRNKLTFLSTYLHAVRQPRFQLTVTGHAKKDPAQRARAARRLSRRRAREVSRIIRSKGVRQHRVRTVTKGDQGAANTAAWDKVTITAAVRRGYRNRYPVASHEFGHMLGLDDEYPTAAQPGPAVGAGPHTGSKTSHYNLTKQALGQDYADSFARVTVDSEGLLQGGQDLRPHHYVTLWEALGAVSGQAAVPAPKFTRADWKFVGM